MTTIWKYQCPTTEDFTLEVPEDATFVTLALQDRTPCIWFEVEPEKPKETKRFLWVMTGYTFDRTGLHYMGTVLLEQLGLVIHLYGVGLG